MADDRYNVGTVLESKDRKYEPDRRIRLPEVTRPGRTAGPVWRVWRVETIADPSRPDRVGSRTRIAESTLRQRWQAPTMLCDSCAGQGGSAASGTVCGDCMGSGRKWEADA